MWEKFDVTLKSLFRLCNGKEVCLWGYGYSGKFCEHLFHRAHKKIAYIFDDSPTIDCKLEIERSFLLKELNPKTHIVLLTFVRDEKAVAFLENLGYVEHESFIFVREWFYKNTDANRKLSYYDWLEYCFELDITQSRMLNEIQVASNDCLYYSPIIDYSLVDVLDNFEFDKDDAVFDFGCGKGGALLLFHSHGVGRIGGVEYDKDLYETVQINMKRMDLDASGLLNEDAAKVTEHLDSYNYFFMYNPFQGKTFDKVVKNLEESFARKKRKMYVIYSGPFCHDMLVKNGIFRFSKVIRTDCSVKNVRVYCTDIR